MRLTDALGQFVEDLKRQRLRTALTILGITWGTVAIVVLLAFGTGLERQSKKNMKGMGDGIVVVFGGTTSKAFNGFPDGRRIRLRESDGALLQQEIPGIADLSPEYIHSRTPMRVGTAATTPTVTGILPVYGDMRNVIPEPGGRFINDPDVEHRRRVVVLGNEIKNLLFGDQDAIGQRVLLGETPFVVVGVMQEKTQNSSYHARDADRAFIPASTHRALFGDRYLNNMIYRPASPDISDAVETQVYATLGRALRFDADDEDALGVWDTNEMFEFLHYFFVGFNIFMGIIGSFTLTVGGIGVANIMYVVVRERTREIGIKRSVGARRRDILRQFFLETFLIVGVGAGVGFVVALGLVELITLFPIEDYVGTPEISPPVAVITMLLLALVALLAGFFPARKASRLDPVECLRS